MIANRLHSIGIDYKYERSLEGTTEPGRRWSDFTFFTPADERIVEASAYTQP